MRSLFFILSFFLLPGASAQTYIPMPTDSAAWRYRIYDIDYVTQVFDVMVYQNGEDTTANGATYYKLFSRLHQQVGPYGFNPAVVPAQATYPDIYYGAIRESGKKVYNLTLAGEELIYDFNAAVGDSIPAYDSKKAVVAIDSILLNGLYHKRFLTTDTAYYVVEGAGSSEGLIPDMNDGSGVMFFYCFTHGAVTFSPDTTIPCTYIYPWNYSSGISSISQQPGTITVFPVPADDVVHIRSSSADMQVTVSDEVGRTMWRGPMNEQLDIPVGNWADGLYYVHFTGGKAGTIIRKMMMRH